MTSAQVVVTGGAGFVGSHLVERLLREGHAVTVLDRGMSRNLEGVASRPGFRLVEGDIRKLEDVQRVIRPGVTHVFHLSSLVGVKHYVEDPLAVIDVNVGGTRNVLAAAAQAGRPKVLLTSTSEVYGKNPKVPWKEEDDRVLGATTFDRWSYSTSKAVAEHMVLGFSKATGLPATIVRFFNVYGPRQNPQLVVSQSVYRAMRGERPLLYDGGAQTRCFTFVEDAVEGTMRAMFAPEADGHVFNIGSDRETSIREIVELVIRAAGTVDSWEPVDTNRMYGSTYEDIPRRVPDVSKARRLLGWSAQTLPEEGIRRTVEWARANPWYLKA